MVDFTLPSLCSTKRFFKSSVVKKEEIGSKIVGDGLIAVTNWHLLAGIENTEEEETETPGDVNPIEVIKSVLPARPSTNTGNDLNVLDNSYGQGKSLAYLRDLSDLVVFNDEAHHIHEVRKGQETTEVEWQKSLSNIAETKNEKFIQVDFSATQYYLPLVLKILRRAICQNKII